MAPERAVRGALLAALSLIGSCARAPSPTSRVPGRGQHPYVVLVSFDAFRHDYIDRHAPRAFVDIAARGIRAEALIPAYPSKTFPNHYTIVTGVRPGRHGIVGNAFYDPSRKAWYRAGDPKAVLDSSWYGGEPIWVTAERNGVRAGSFFWPGSEAAIGGVRPSYVAAYDGRVPNARRVDSALAWLRLPPAARPHLVLMYFSEVDDSSHKFGPTAPQTALAVASVNAALQRLLDGLRALPISDSINIVVVSDHGMADTPAAQVIPVADILSRAGVDTSGTRFSDNGPNMSLWFGGDSAKMRRAHAALTTGLAHARVHYRPAIPERWHIRDNPRAGDLLLVAEEGYTLQRTSRDPAPSAGQHGYDPAMANMRGTFLAAGPNVRAAGRVPAFENIDVYPFLAALLQLDHVPAVDGNPTTLGRLVVRHNP